MDEGIKVDYTLKIEGDKLKGKGAAEFGGDKQEWDIEGKKQKDDRWLVSRPCGPIPSTSRFCLLALVMI